ncbi:hypothetical protein F4677DRAFT_225102 [Hypoxylon crocopeplum]|nr:hypothetical protein F4677DRAFT_225102 [Hypoxylon crocopeplum]
MSHHTPDTWWHRNHLQCWNYPKLPTKKELIYRVFRAAYPNGAFVDDDLKLVKLRDKDMIWRRVVAEFTKAYNDLEPFLLALFAEEPRLRSDQQKQSLLYDYYGALLEESRYALFVSQNGRYFEFRSMEELLVRYIRTNRETWARDHLDPEFYLPSTEGFLFAREHLELVDGSEAKSIQRRLKDLEKPTRRQ